ncbi:cyclic peptide export ABC transporter [Xanthobacter sp. 126]|uniref:cyclic peptide export ABC transporter n=1 Tax=Xanthobacter sp. 126 TaxID=1131814 RepID=UPI00045E9A87|nr:cyclic peptide export ABC transporter [Xanthobacter sp. 126]
MSANAPLSASAVLLHAGQLLAPLWRLLAIATAAGLCGGLATPWLLSTVNLALHAPSGEEATPIISFVALCGLSLGGTALAGALNSILGQKLIAALRKDISARILRAPIARLEDYRSHRLMAVLTTDVDTVSAFTFNMSGYAIALAVTLGSIGYLAALSPAACVMAMLFLGLSAAAKRFAQHRWIRDYEAVRHAQDDLHRQYRSIIEGAKELKLHQPRRALVFGTRLGGAADLICRHKSRAMTLYWVADVAGTGGIFILIGLLIAAHGALGMDSVALSGAVIVLLYVRGPIELLGSALPMLDQARIALERIARLSQALADSEPGLMLAKRAAKAPPTFTSITLTAIIYRFPAMEGAPFVLGPLDLRLERGELVFIVGANGSGKTTLVKLLLGLYAPSSGTVWQDGVAVTAERRDDYRQLFSPIFSDYFLFDEIACDLREGAASALLERFDLAGKVSLEGGRFSTTDLSTGQRKRLALVEALLERRPILITDEWAADQDPDFRRLFYEELLPELKREGRTLIVVSHDDRYFHLADRIVRMAEGRIVEDAQAVRPRIGMENAP